MTMTSFNLPFIEHSDPYFLSSSSTSKLRNLILWSSECASHECVNRLHDGFRHVAGVGVHLFPLFERIHQYPGTRIHHCPLKKAIAHDPLKVLAPSPVSFPSIIWSNPALSIIHFFTFTGESSPS